MKAIIFDWDLTLWNSWDPHPQLMQRTADALGLPRPSGSEVTDEYHRPFFQHLTWFFGDDEQRVVDTYMGFYQQWVNTVGHLYPGVMESLETLKHRGYKIAVFSDKRKQFGELEVEQAGLGHLLDYTLCLVDGRPYKARPLRTASCPGGVRRTEKPSRLRGGRESRSGVCPPGWHRRRRSSLGSVNREDLLSGHPDHSWETVDQLLLSLE